MASSRTYDEEVVHCDPMGRAISPPPPTPPPRRSDRIKKMRLEKELECSITGTPDAGWTIDPESKDAATFRIQENLQRKWGYEVQLLKDLWAGSTLKYTGRLVDTDPDNGYVYKIGKNKFLDPLPLPSKSIAILFNDDRKNLLKKKAVWEATDSKDKTSVTYTLTEDASKGDICCVDYGEEYNLPDSYVNTNEPDITMWEVPTLTL
jgi:hypothetical protein